MVYILGCWHLINSKLTYYEGDKMSKTISFYNVAIIRNGKKTNLDFLRFIDTIAAISWENRVRKINDDITAMFPLYFNDQHPQKRIIPFGKFRRDYKPFIGHITTSRLRAVKNDVVELVTMVYDKNYRTAVIDFNLYGPKQRRIEEYLTSFLPKKDNEEWEVKLFPIISKKGKEDIEKSMQVKYLEIKLKLDKYTQELINTNITVTKDRSLINFLYNINDSGEPLSADTMRIEWAVRHGKNVTMDLATVKQLLSILNIEHECIESVKVRYRDIHTEKLDTIDLKNLNQQLKDTILENDSNRNPAPEYVGNVIIEMYELYEGTLIQSYREFISDMIEAEFPEIQSIPREEHRVESE